MGQNGSLDLGIAEFLKTEFSEKKEANDRDYLTLAEVLTLQPPEEYPFDLLHIGLVFVLDSDLDGRVSYPELEKFALFCGKELKPC